METKIYLSFLAFCAILSEGIGTPLNVSALKEDIEKPPNIHIRNKRVLDREHQILTPAKLRNFPYMVNLHRNGLFACGGAILAAHIVITAAHCLMEPNSNYTIMSGSDYANGGQVHEVIRHMPYPNYTHGVLLHDIALVTILPPIDLVNSLNRPIEIFDGNIEAGTMASVVGWGISMRNGEMIHTGELLFVKTRIMDERECRLICDAPECIAKLRICSADGFGHGASSSGDSGGPLVVQNRLVGILSCTVTYSPTIHREKPDVSTNVSHPFYKNWIQAFIRHYKFTLGRNAHENNQNILHHNMHEEFQRNIHPDRREHPHYNGNHK